jgi:hypothetical protein
VGGSDGWMGGGRDRWEEAMGGWEEEITSVGGGRDGSTVCIYRYIPVLYKERVLTMAL